MAVSSHHFRYSGFTLVELVLVMVIMGILVAVAIPRFADVDKFKERAFADGALSAVRYFQKLAISTGCDVWVDLDQIGGGRPAEIYAGQHVDCDTPSEFTNTLFKDDAGARPVLDPSGANLDDDNGTPRMIIQAPTNYDIENIEFFFDKIGRPHRETASTTRDYFNNALTIDLERADGTVFDQLQIEPDTGFSTLIGPP